MINIKNIAKLLLLALFVCAFSGEAGAQQYWKQTDGTYKDAQGSTIAATDIPNDATIVDVKTGKSTKYQGLVDHPPKPDSLSRNSQVDASFCSGNLGIFSELVKTGTDIFYRLRDLIYVVAGFGIIAVAVGGFFGNLNWKWLGAIVISLVVIATAGELLVLLTGCENFDQTLITNSLKDPAGKASTMSSEDYMNNYTTEDYEISYENRAAREEYTPDLSAKDRIDYEGTLAEFGYGERAEEDAGMDKAYDAFAKQFGIDKPSVKPKSSVNLDSYITEVEEEFIEEEPLP